MANKACGAEPALNTYLLTTHTFVSRVNDSLVFLDLRTDNYLCIEPQYTNRLSELLGIPAVTPVGAGRCAGDECPVMIEPILDQMIEARLLTRDPNSGKPAVPIAAPDQVREMPGFDIDEEPKMTARHVFAFLKAVVVSKALLGLFPIERVVGQVAARRKWNAKADCESAQEFVEMYRKLRPLFVSRKDECLFNSLSLIEFLASFAIYPSWYFGVQLNEFRAHCWVQEDDLIYDDHAEVVCEYSVIMRVRPCTAT